MTGYRDRLDPMTVEKALAAGMEDTAIRQWGFLQMVSTSLILLPIGETALGQEMLDIAGVWSTAVTEDTAPAETARADLPDNLPEKNIMKSNGDLTSYYQKRKSNWENYMASVYAKFDGYEG